MASSRLRFLLSFALVAVGLLCATQVAALPMNPAPAEERSVSKIADGVFVIRHKEVPFEGGNTTVIIGEKSVMVVDSCGRPSATKYDLERIRELTPKPVRYLLNTHWHSDHNVGNYLYARTYPGVQVISHRETKVEMDLFTKSYKPRLTTRLAALKDQLAKGVDREGKPANVQMREAQQQALAGLESEIQEAVDYEYYAPTQVFDTGIDIDLGGRMVEVRHLGRGNTVGDAIAYVPDAKVIATGDLVVHPIPFTYDGYPREWIKTLEKLASYDASAIVPGHGAVLRDKQYLLLVRDFMQSAVSQLNVKLMQIGPALFRNFDEVKDDIDLSSFRAKFAGNDAQLIEDFNEIASRLKILVFREAQVR